MNPVIRQHVFDHDRILFPCNFLVKSISQQPLCCLYAATYGFFPKYEIKDMNQDIVWLISVIFPNFLAIRVGPLSWASREYKKPSLPCNRERG